VMYEEASEARKMTGPTNSSGRPRRAMGVITLSKFWRIAGLRAIPVTS
jgi:hypothetical protein